LPYISRKVRTILAVSSKPPAIETTSTIILTNICQPGTSVERAAASPSPEQFSGKIVKKTKAGLFREQNNSGRKPER